MRGRPELHAPGRPLPSSPTRGARPRSLPPDGGEAHGPALLVTRDGARQESRLARGLPLVLVLRPRQVVARLEPAGRRGVPDGREARLALVLVDVQVGEVAPLPLVLVEELLVLGRRQERPRLRADARAEVLVERRVEALAADRDDRDVPGLPRPRGQFVEPLLVLGRGEAVVGRHVRPGVLDEDGRVAHPPAGRVAVHLPELVARGLILVEGVLVLLAVEAVDRRPLHRALGAEDGVEVNLAFVVVGVDPFEPVVGADRLVDEALVVLGGDAVARDLGRAGSEVAGHVPGLVVLAALEHPAADAADARDAVALAAVVVLEEAARRRDRVGRPRHADLEVEVVAARAADLALVAEVGAGLDELPDLEPGLP